MGIFRYGQVELDYLKSRDKKLGNAIDQIGIIEREINTDLFTAIVKSIIAQQISSKASATIWNRIKQRFIIITPQIIADAEIEEIQQCGLSKRKATYIKGIADVILKGTLNLSELYGLSDIEIIKKLSCLNGIGVWTAEMLLIFSMERPDVLSWNDLAIKRGIMNLHCLQSLNKEQFEEYRKLYSPYCSIASLYLWALSVM